MSNPNQMILSLFSLTTQFFSALLLFQHSLALFISQIFLFRIDNTKIPWRRFCNPLLSFYTHSPHVVYINVWRATPATMACGTCDLWQSVVKCQWHRATSRWQLAITSLKEVFTAKAWEFLSVTACTAQLAADASNHPRLKIASDRCPHFARSAFHRPQLERSVPWKHRISHEDRINKNIWESGPHALRRMPATWFHHHHLRTPNKNLRNSPLSAPSITRSSLYHSNGSKWTWLRATGTLFWPALPLLVLFDSFRDRRGRGPVKPRHPRTWNTRTTNSFALHLFDLNYFRVLSTFPALRAPISHSHNHRKKTAKPPALCAIFPTKKAKIHKTKKRQNREKNLALSSASRAVNDFRGRWTSFLFSPRSRVILPYNPFDTFTTHFSPRSWMDQTELDALTVFTLEVIAFSLWKPRLFTQFSRENNGPKNFPLRLPKSRTNERIKKIFLYWKFACWPMCDRDAALSLRRWFAGNILKFGSWFLKLI